MRLLIYTIFLTQLSFSALSFTIDQSCGETKEAIKQALQALKKREFPCLNKLGRRDLVLRLSAFLSSAPHPHRNIKPLTLNCFSDTSITFGSLAPNAYATLPHDDEFPTIDLNLFDMNHVDRSTIFHELFHLLGYDHSGSTLEIAYACKFACDEHVENSKIKKAAINICSGKYTSTKEPSYQKDRSILKEGFGLPI